MRVTLDMIQANKEFTDLAGSVGLTLRDLMYDQGRLLAQDAVRRVKPGGPQQGTAAQKKAGLQAVSNDVRRMFWGVDDQAVLTAWDEHLQKRGIEMPIETKQGIRILRSEKLLNRVDSQTMRDVHGSKRNNKGRVRFRRNGSDVAAGKYIASERAVVRYIKEQQKKVGQLKAGFVAAADHFAGLAGTTAKAIPSWVRKQARRMGSQVNGVNSTTGVGYVEVINLVPYADRAIPHSLVSWLEANRQRDITRNAKKRLNKVAKDHNAKYARAA
jgi:hypothetical protein